jgi:major type 1 subunit fimbrin (pilin)
MRTANGAIAGTVGAKLTNRSPSGDGNGWVFYTGVGSNYVGLSSALTLFATTCTLSTNNVTVTLPTIVASALSGGAGALAGTTPFTLTLSGCTASATAYAVQALWSFTQSPVSPAVIANTAANPASNVYVQLTDSSNSTISPGRTTPLAPNATAGGTYQTQFFARYYRGSSAAVGAGNVQGVATLTLTYQ